MNVRAPSPLADTATEAAGRMCPIDYAYSPRVFARQPDLAAETIYVVGGLYGNLQALARIKELAAAEAGPVTIVFNGDFHWFDADADWFDAIERGVADFPALRGNVESEISRAGDIGAGCGCAYPSSVAADIVERSNDILAQLRAVTPAAARKRLGTLPMQMVAQIGDCRVGIVHGDATALAGWRFAQDMLDDPAREPWLTDIRAQSGVDIFASTHTCLAALRQFDLPSGHMTVVNNGASGMPNFAGRRSGVLTRLSLSPSRYAPLYGARQGHVHIDALAIDGDHDAFIAQFLARWPQGSAAHRSYFDRIAHGPDYSPDNAQARAGQPRP